MGITTTPISTADRVRANVKGIQWSGENISLSDLTIYPCIARLVNGAKEHSSSDADSTPMLLLSKCQGRRVKGEVVKWNGPGQSSPFTDVGLQITVPVANNGWFGSVDKITGRSTVRRWFSVVELSTHVNRSKHENRRIYVLTHNRLSCIRKREPPPSSSNTMYRSHASLPGRPALDVQLYKPACLEEGSELEVHAVIKADDKKLRRKHRPLISLSRLFSSKPKHLQRLGEDDRYCDSGSSSDLLRCSLIGELGNQVYLIPCDTSQSVCFSEIHQPMNAVDVTFKDNTTENVPEHKVIADERARKIRNFLVPNTDLSVPIILAMTRGSFPINDELNNRFTGLFRMHTCVTNNFVYAMKDVNDPTAKVIELAENSMIQVAESCIADIDVKDYLFNNIQIANQMVLLMESAISIKESVKSQGCPRADRSLPPIPSIIAEDEYSIVYRSKFTTHTRGDAQFRICRRSSSLNAETETYPYAGEQLMDDYGYMIPTQNRCSFLGHSKSDIGATGSYYRSRGRSPAPCHAPSHAPAPTVTTTYAEFSDSRWKNDIDEAWLSPYAVTAYPTLGHAHPTLGHAHSDADLLLGRQADRDDLLDSNTNINTVKLRRRYVIHPMKRKPRSTMGIHQMLHSRSPGRPATFPTADLATPSVVPTNLSPTADLDSRRCCHHSTQPRQPSLTDGFSTKDFERPLANTYQRALPKLFCRNDRRRWSVDRMDDFLTDSLQQSLSLTTNNRTPAASNDTAFTVGNTTYNVAPPGRLLLKSRTLSPSHESAHFDYFSFGDLTSANWRSRRNVDPENVHYKCFCEGDISCSTPKATTPAAKSYSFASDPGHESIEKTYKECSLYSPPEDINMLGISEVLSALNYLGIPPKVIESFRQQKIDGPLLCGLDSSMIHEAFPESSRLDRKKIVDFVAGWRPKS